MSESQVANAFEPSAHCTKFDTERIGRYISIHLRRIASKKEGLCAIFKSKWEAPVGISFISGPQNKIEFYRETLWGETREFIGSLIFLNP